MMYPEPTLAECMNTMEVDAALHQTQQACSYAALRSHPEILRYQAGTAAEHPALGNILRLITDAAAAALAGEYAFHAAPLLRCIPDACTREAALDFADAITTMLVAIRLDQDQDAPDVEMRDAPRVCLPQTVAPPDTPPGLSPPPPPAYTRPAKQPSPLRHATCAPPASVPAGAPRIRPIERTMRVHRLSSPVREWRRQQRARVEACGEFSSDEDEEDNWLGEAMQEDPAYPPSLFDETTVWEADDEAHGCISDPRRSLFPEVVQVERFAKPWDDACV